MCPLCAFDFIKVYIPEVMWANEVMERSTGNISAHLGFGVWGPGGVFAEMVRECNYLRAAQQGQCILHGVLRFQGRHQTAKNVTTGEDVSQSAGPVGRRGKVWL